MLTRRSFMQAAAVLPFLPLGSEIRVQPLDPFEVWAVPVLAQTLSEIYGYRVVVQDPIPVPASARVAPRNRYHAPTIAYSLGSRLTLGITNVDICQPYDHPTHGHVTDWGVIGVAQLGGPTGVISTARIKDRAWLPYIVAHEAGHLRGYKECATEGCQMMDVLGDGTKYDTMRYGWFCDQH